MEMPDVNVLVQAYRVDSASHPVAAEWLAGAMRGGETFGMSELVLSAAVRVLTHPGASRFPPDKHRILRFVEGIHAHPNCRVVRPGSRHFRLFLDLCQPVGVHGAVVPDAYHAALAIESGCEFVTSDRGFARFPGLRWRLLG